MQSTMGGHWWGEYQNLFPESRTNLWFDSHCSLIRGLVIVLWVDTGIVTIPLFKIDVPSSSECIRFGSEFSGTETDYEVESRKVFGPTCLSTHEDFCR